MSLDLLGEMRDLTKRYREFLLDPGTIFTAVSGLLLISAAMLQPEGLIHSTGEGEANSILYLAAALVGSSYIWWSALQGIRERDFTADIPVSLATMAAIAIGQYPAAAVVAVLLLLGGLLEGFVATRATKSLESLAKLLPDFVTVRRGGRDEVVPLSEVKVGEILLIRSGERIAVDGMVVSGSAHVNQAAITGESLLIEKKPGDPVFAGTLNEVGAAEVKAASLGSDTTLGQIRSMIEDAQSHKPPIERLLDRYAKLYMPAALILGALLWWWSGDIMRAITMLIVFCPCVIVLATPTALVAAIGNAAMRGNLVKKGAAIEALSKVDTVVFDKTGTLTIGQPKLVEAVALREISGEDLLFQAAIAEKFSEHPVGKATVQAAAKRGLSCPDPEAFEALPGLGVRATVEGHQICLGRLKMLKGQGFLVSHESEILASNLESEGKSVNLVAIDGMASGLLVFEDEIRPESNRVIEQLDRLGLRTVMVTGDNKTAASRVAEQIGINEIFAEAMPQEKVEIVKKLQSGGHRVAFVGEGVNDGPALAAADVGIAMGLSGTDVAMETADIGLLFDDLSKLPHLIVISRRAIKVIKQNLIFSVGVLAAAVTLTIPGILTPVTGALLHELSSIPVIANSVRLIAYGPKVEPGGKTHSSVNKEKDTEMTAI